MIHVRNNMDAFMQRDILLRIPVMSFSTLTKVINLISYPKPT